jgi:peptidoglycan/LPS O-acetylase OafA/YrhL
MQGYKANLDLLRAIAITVVFVFHISQFITGFPVNWLKIAALGSYGVDLFFVLSGWLIGGIFFREYSSTGHVKLVQFWARRWLRTMPPYYVALIISWLLVYLARNQNFDIKYLFFLQNYSGALPFFKISWSLCIEEHFYIFLPIILYIGLKYDIVVGICIALITASFCMRLQYNAVLPAFGYQLTATHLRLDGLSLGVLCAYIYYVKNFFWERFSSVLIRLGSLCGIITLLLYFLFSQLMYSFGILSLSLFFASLLCISVNAPDWRVSRFRIISIIAVSSYSIYLTHAIAINLAMHFIPSGGINFVGSSIILTAGMSIIFHIGIENVSKRIRDNFFPNRLTTQLNPA